MWHVRRLRAFKDATGQRMGSHHNWRLLDEHKQTLKVRIPIGRLRQDDFEGLKRVRQKFALF